MTLRLFALATLASSLAIASVACDSAPGKPKTELTAQTIRPDQVRDFSTLYRQNCAGCHGDQGKSGAAISLANPLYLQFAGAQNLERITANGIPGTMMPGFAESAGGMLTDQQITIITQGMIQAWGNSSLLNGPSLPPYASTLPADPTRGETTFGTYCARCHGADATGTSGKGNVGSLVDPAYLSLISDQGLRTILIVGKPDEGTPSQRMTDYRSYPGHALTDQEITDIVAWLASHRTANPGQIYRQHP